VWTSTCLAVASIAIATGSSGCGDARSDDRSAVRAAFHDLSRDLEAGDLGHACERLTANAVDHIGGLTNVPPRGCPQRVRALLRATATSRDGTRGRLKVVSVILDGKRARIRARYRGGWTVWLPFVRDGGTWKADEIAGISGPPPTIDLG